MTNIDDHANDQRLSIGYIDPHHKRHAVLHMRGYLRCMEQVIEGEVLRGPEVVLPRPKRRRRWPWIVGAVAGLLACCLAVPIAVIVVPVIKDTLAASRGSNSPQEALLSYMLTFQPPAEAQRLDAERYIVRKHRKAMLKQRADYLNAIEATNRAYPDQPASLAIGHDENHQTQVDIHGDRATVTEYWEVHLTFVQDHPGSAIGAATEPQPWTATAQRERDGWRLTSLTMPPWCSTRHDDGTTTGYVKC
jgi:hypothetical protein